MCHFGMCPCTLIWGPALWVCDLCYHTASCAEVWPVLGLILCYYYLASLPNFFFFFLVCLIFEQDVLYFLFTLGPTNMEPIQIIFIHSFNISFSTFLFSTFFNISFQLPHTVLVQKHFREQDSRFPCPHGVYIPVARRRQQKQAQQTIPIYHV